MRLGVEVKGLNELLGKLDKLEGAHKNKTLERGLANGGAVAVEAAQDIVPVDSGNLRASLHVGGYTRLTPGWRKVGKYGELRHPEGRGKEVEVYLGSTLPYAHLVERGTSHSQAIPYMRRAIDENQTEILAAVDDSVQEIIDKG